MFAKSRWNAEKYALFSQQLAQLLESGVPLLDALGLLGEQHLLPEPWNRRLREMLQQGSRLSAAFRSLGFPPLFVSFIRAAEEHGDYAFGFRQCEAYYAARNKWIRELWQACLYPLIVLGMVGASFLFLASVVLPRFGELYRTMGIPLPWATRLLFAVYDRWHLVPAAAGLLLGIVLIIHGYVQGGPDSRKEAWERLFFRIPVIRDVWRLRMTQYVSVQLGALLKAGVPLLAALELVERETPWISLAGGLKRIRVKISEGSPLHRAIRDEAQEMFLPVLVRLVALAENTGNVNEAFLLLARGTETAIKTRTERFTRSLEPLLIFCVGLLIAAMVIALFLPMLQMVRAL